MNLSKRFTISYGLLESHKYIKKIQTALYYKSCLPMSNSPFLFLKKSLYLFSYMYVCLCMVANFTSAYTSQTYLKGRNLSWDKCFSKIQLQDIF